MEYIKRRGKNNGPAAHELCMKSIVSLSGRADEDGEKLSFIGLLAALSSFALPTSWYMCDVLPQPHSTIFLSLSMFACADAMREENSHCKGKKNGRYYYNNENTAGDHINDNLGIFEIVRAHRKDFNVIQFKEFNHSISSFIFPQTKAFVRKKNWIGASQVYLQGIATDFLMIIIIINDIRKCI